jgi:hypothetical protein
MRRGPPPPPPTSTSGDLRGCWQLARNKKQETPKNARHKKTNEGWEGGGPIARKKKKLKVESWVLFFKGAVFFVFCHFFGHKSMTYFLGKKQFRCF